MFKRQIIIFLLGFLAIFQANAFNTTGIEFPFSFTVAAHVKNDENAIRSFHIQCSPGFCSLERYAIGMCIKNKEGKLTSVIGGFKITTYSDFLEAELVNSTLKLTLYQGTHHTFPTTIIATFENESLTKLKSFEANELQSNNHIHQPGDSFDADLDKVEYVPFKGNILKKLDCPFLLPGINQ
jgi:hypothetical protein